MNPSATKFELEHYFKIANPKIIAVDAKLLINVEHAVGALQIRPTIIVIDDAGGRPSASQTVVRRRACGRSDIELTMKVSTGFCSAHYKTRAS